MRHKCEAEKNDDGTYSCELCRIDSKTYLAKGRNCKGWKLLENFIECDFTRYVEKNGDEAIKYEIRKGDPDRLVLIAPNYFFFIEFKRKGEELTPLQKERHKELKDRGYNVYSTSSLKEAKEIYHKEKDKVT